MFLAIAGFLFQASYAQRRAELADVVQNARVETSSAGLVTKVAPGEVLPVSVKLLNFGGGTKVDVILHYAILTSTGREIYASNETVAVETTANFIKTIQVPFETLPGTYIAKTSVTYGGQLVPAVTEFPFRVERRILGLFQSDFLLYGGSVILVSIGMVMLRRSMTKRRNARRFSPFDYSEIPHHERAFFELISDTIMEMREQVGDAALDIAAHTQGLVIDEKTGRVLKVTEIPSQVIARLVSGYEYALGKRVSFTFRMQE